MPNNSGLREYLEPWIERCEFPAPGEPLRCGVSGGTDSLALMALASAAGCDVTAVHVDHGLRPGGTAEADAVHASAQAVGASFESVSLAIEPGPNLEERMRTARHEVLGPDAATGHTADDQAETVLINLMRGSGLRGLGAMEPGPRHPILRLRRTDTEAVCSTLSWTPFHDPSNEDMGFVRNRVRRQLLVLMNDIAQRDVVPLINRTARHSRSASNVVLTAANELDPTDAKTLAAAPVAVAALALQNWVRSNTGDTHPLDLASIERVFAVARGEVIAAEVNGGHRISRHEQRLHINRPD